jgi:hypothetical protein
MPSVTRDHDAFGALEFVIALPNRNKATSTIPKSMIVAIDTNDHSIRQTVEATVQCSG